MSDKHFQITSKDTILKQAIYLNELEAIYKYNENLTGIANLPSHNLASILYKCIFVNLCGEPIVYINDIAYILRDVSNPLTNAKYIKDINSEVIENIEMKLKDDIIRMTKNNHHIKVYREENNILVESDINAIRILTPKEFFNNHKIKGYYRVPISSHGCGIVNGSIDNLCDIFIPATYDEKIVIHSGSNSTRNTMTYAIWCILLQKQDLNTKRHSINEKMNSFYVVNNLMHLLSDKMHQLKIANIFEALAQEKQYDKIIEKIVAKPKLDENDMDYIVVLLKRYCTLVLFSLYVSNNSKNMSFRNFISSNYEYNNFYTYVNKKKSEILLARMECHPVKTLTQSSDKFNVSKYIFVGLDDKNLKKHKTIDMNKSKTSMLFVNLKEELVFYIKDSAFAIREKFRAHKNFTAFRMAPTEKIAAIETLMIDDIKEQAKNQSKIIVYTCKNKQLQSKTIENLNVDDIKAQDEYFKTKHDSYFRFPVTSSIVFRFRKIDEFIDFIQRRKNDFGSVMLHSDTSKGRSSYFCIISNIVLGTKITNKSNEEIYNIECFLSLMHLIDDGRKTYQIVNALFEKYFNETFKVFLLRERENKKIYRTIQKFFLLICLHAYINAKDINQNSFEDWLLDRKDILTLYNKIPHYKTEDITESTIIRDSKIKLQDGLVLNEHSILKNDYFIGSKFFNLFEHIKGVQNLRMVDFAHLMIIGVSMPTVAGVNNLVQHLENNHNIGSNTILWICLREEPVIYVDKRPYVLRHYTDVNQNIEMTGVTVNKIEELEVKLKNDVLRHKDICLFDEVDTNKTVETISLLVKYRTIQTPNEVYKQSISNYYRIPVTDEQAPIPSIVDSIYKLVKSRQYKALVFNCQMGKGRTTTGMIIAHLTNFHSQTIGKKYVIKYKLISILVKILRNGHKSLAICDEVIDKYDHLENLRDVICKYDGTTAFKKKKNFLLRYFHLICFTEFLMQDKHKSYEEYLDKNSAILDLIGAFDKIGFDLV